MEIELRVLIDEAKEQEVKNLLDSLAKEGKKEKQADKYFKFIKDEERKLVLRIREKKEKSFLTFKGSSKEPEDIAWQEWETEIKDTDNLEKLFISNGLEIVVEIVKTRIEYKYDDMSINLDNIENLGTFIEVEIISENVEEAKNKIQQFLFEKLNLNQENIIQEGYVPLMLKKIEFKNE
jgi:adenylate cyclase class 2